MDYLNGNASKALYGQGPSTHEYDATPRITVLLVEDNSGDLGLVKRMLEADVGFDLIHAPSLGEALNSLHRLPDVILLDLDLPDSSGLDTLRVLRQHHRSIPIVILTGRDDQRLAQEALHNRAQDYLVKGQIDATLLTRVLVHQVSEAKASAPKL